MEVRDLYEYVYKTLSPIFPENRVFPEHLPESHADFPSIVYRQIGGVAWGTNCDTSFSELIEIMIYAKDTITRLNEIKQVIGAFEQDSIIQINSAPILNFDFYTKTHVATLTYTAF